MIAKVAECHHYQIPRDVRPFEAYVDCVRAILISNYRAKNGWKCGMTFKMIMTKIDDQNQLNDKQRMLAIFDALKITKTKKIVPVNGWVNVKPGDEWWRKYSKFGILNGRAVTMTVAERSVENTLGLSRQVLQKRCFELNITLEDAMKIAKKREIKEKDMMIEESIATVMVIG